MKTYFFALGTNHTLSKIDVVNVLARKGVAFEIIEASEEVLLVQTETELEVDSLMLELGSAAKIGEILKGNIRENLEDNLEEILKEELKDKVKRERFGISVYGAGGKFKELNAVFESSKEIGRKIREIRGIREIRENGRVLSTVAVDKNGLLGNGFELVICVGSKGIYLGKTLVVQDYESYSTRDYGRPARDVQSGMIPPKLAKMMINLAGKEKSDLFLDPFCGGGTILQELILLGYKNIIGTDASERSVNDSRTNLDWLESRFKQKESGLKQIKDIKLLKADVRKLSSVINFKTVDAIVTEPYLGSPKAKYFNPQQIKEEINKLEELYLAAFNEFRKILHDNGAMVIIFPVFRFGSLFFHLEILEKIAALGFKKREFIVNPPTGGELLNLNLTPRGGVIFFRPGQTVSREIFVFQVLQSNK